jgi:hypothetical protein
MASSSFILTAAMKDFFFDRDNVRAILDWRNLKALERAGQWARTTAINSMRDIPATKLADKRRAEEDGLLSVGLFGYEPSPQGKPPYAITGHPWIKSGMMDIFDPTSKTMVVGPLFMQRRHNVPRILEEGGPTTIRNPRRTYRKIGSGGEIELGRRTGGTTTKRNTPVQGLSQIVTYIKIRTQKQADRANRLNEALYGATNIPITIHPHPFMAPTMEKLAPRLDKMWDEAYRLPDGGVPFRQRYENQGNFRFS